MAFAEDIGRKGQDHLHGCPPLGDVGAEGRQEGAVDVLAEEDPLAVLFQQDDDGAGGVAGGVETAKVLSVEIRDSYKCLKSG